MRDLGVIQGEVMNRLKKASNSGDGHVLGIFGPVAAEMERKGAEWEALLNLPPTGGAPPNGVSRPANSAAPSGTPLAGRDIHGVTILGSSVPVGSYKDALFVVVKRLQAAHLDFDTVAPFVRGRGPYFSEHDFDLRKGERIKNSKLFIETNLSADRIWDTCRELVRRFGHNPDDHANLYFDVASTRTRNRRSRQP